MKNLVTLLLLLPALAFGQSKDFASTGYAAGAAEYLKRPVHAQSAGLSGAVVAWRENCAGTQYNPALYDSLQNGSLMVKGTYSFLTLDRKHAGVEVSGAAGQFLAYGVSFITYGVDKIQETDSVGNELGTFSYMENALAASVAGRIPWNIALGATVRYLNSRLYTENANGFGFDVGATWEPLDILTVGASVQNIGSNIWWSTGTSEPVLPCVRLGVNGMLLKKSLITEIDVVKTLQQPLEASMGVQYTLFDMISVRGGISSDLDYEKFHTRYPDYSLGIGIYHMFFRFAYALSIPASDLGLTHKVTLVVTLKNLFK